MMEKIDTERKWTVEELKARGIVYNRMMGIHTYGFHDTVTDMMYICSVDKHDNVTILAPDIGKCLKPLGKMGKMLAYGTLMGSFVLTCCSSTQKPKPVVVGNNFDVNDNNFNKGYASKIINATHRLTVDKGTGSCASFAEDGTWSYLFTANHVIDGEKHISVENWTAEVVQIDKNADVALLRTKKKFASYIPLAERDAEIGDVILGCGYPNGLEAHLTKGIIAGKTPHGYHTDLSIDYGFSGGGGYVSEYGNPRQAGVIRYKYGSGQISGISDTKSLRELVRKAKIGNIQ